VVRFVGQRVAAVVPETEAAAEAACRLIEVEYEILTAVFDPEAAMRPEAPLLHDKDHRYGNVYVDIHGEVGSTAEGSPPPMSCMRGLFTSRVQHFVLHLDQSAGSSAAASVSGTTAATRCLQSGPHGRVRRCRRIKPVIFMSGGAVEAPRHVFQVKMATTPGTEAACSRPTRKNSRVRMR